MFHTLTYTGGGSASQRCLLQQPHNLNCRRKVGVQACWTPCCGTHTNPQSATLVARIAEPAVPDQTPETLSAHHTTSTSYKQLCWRAKSNLQGQQQPCRAQLNLQQQAQLSTHRDMQLQLCRSLCCGPQLQPCSSYRLPQLPLSAASAHKHASRLPHTHAAAVTDATAAADSTRLLLLLLLLCCGSCCCYGGEQACVSQQGFS